MLVALMNMITWYLGVIRVARVLKAIHDTITRLNVQLADSIRVLKRSVDAARQMIDQLNDLDGPIDYHAPVTCFGLSVDHVRPCPANSEHCQHV